MRNWSMWEEPLLELTTSAFLRNQYLQMIRLVSLVLVSALGQGGDRLVSVGQPNTILQIINDAKFFIPAGKCELSRNCNEDRVGGCCLRLTHHHRVGDKRKGPSHPATAVPSLRNDRGPSSQSGRQFGPLRSAFAGRTPIKASLIIWFRGSVRNGHFG